MRDQQTFDIYKNWELKAADLSYPEAYMIIAREAYPVPTSIAMLRDDWKIIAHIKENDGTHAS